MANTWIATPINGDERVAQFRSTDFDPVELFVQHGDVAVYDLTNELRPVAYVTGRYDVDGFKPHVTVEVV